MTFEQWLAEWLAQQLQQDIKTVITPDAVSVELRDVLDTGNNWQREGVFGVYCKYKSKQEASEVSHQIQNLLPLLKQENYINGVWLDTETAERTGAPFHWTYTMAIRILHRRRTEW